MNDTPALITVSLAKSYRNVDAMHSLDMVVKRGDIVALVGPNGAGKTTSMRMIAGIIPPTSGSALVAGRDIVKDPVSAKASLAYVPDDPRLFEALTVWEHLDFIAAAYSVPDWKAKAQPLLERFELTEHRDKPAGELSRGMRQKVAIACAYLHDPVLIMLDEPLTGLDPRGIRTMKDTILERARDGAAFVISSHLLALVEDLCTVICIVHKGKQVFFGSVEQARAAFSAGNGATASLEEVFFRATEGDQAQAVDTAAPPPGSGA